MPCIVLISLTGNALQFTADLAQRVLRCTLDAEVDRPELRVFSSIDPVEQVRADRGKFVMAALTILRAYVVAGCPTTPPTPFGGFEDWSDWVRASLIWLGEADPNDVLEAMIEDDPERQQQIQMFAALERVFMVGEHFTVAKIITAAKERKWTEARDENGKARKDADGETVMIDQGPKHPELLDAVREVAGQGRDINNRLLGRWLDKNKNVTIGEDDEARRTFKRQLTRLGILDGARLWKLSGKRPNFAGDE